MLVYNLKQTNFKLKKFYYSLPYFFILIFFVVLPLLVVFLKSVIPVGNYSVAANWEHINLYVWKKLFQSFLDAFLATIFVIIIAYPFAYFLATNRNAKVRSICILLITMPLWTSFLVKLVGLKTLFDTIYGFQNSTYGDIFTIFGLTYIYLPFMVLPLYSVLIDMPKNIVWASRDLGRTNVETFFLVVIPYSLKALFAGITLVFLPSLTTVAVPQFLNNSPTGTLIGDIIVSEGSIALSNPFAQAKAASLTLVLSLILMTGYLIYFGIRKTWLWRREVWKNSGRS